MMFAAQVFATCGVVLFTLYTLRYWRLFAMVVGALCFIVMLIGFTVTLQLLVDAIG